MMLPTHVLGGMLLAAPLVRVAPELAPIGFVAGFLGGLFPDLDMYVGHRKTLHFPVYYSAFAALALFAALAVPSAATVGAALFLLGAAVHSVADMYGGGLELRPWEGNSDRAVYDHYRGTWIARDSSCGTTAQSRTSRCRSGCRFPSSTCSTACFSRSCSARSSSPPCTR